jgi:hypothetical protein
VSARSTPWRAEGARVALASRFLLLSTREEPHMTWFRRRYGIADYGRAFEEFEALFNTKARGVRFGRTAPWQWRGAGRCDADVQCQSGHIAAVSSLIDAQSEVARPSGLSGSAREYVNAGTEPRTTLPLCAAARELFRCAP